MTPAEPAIYNADTVPNADPVGPVWNAASNANTRGVEDQLDRLEEAFGVRFAVFDLMMGRLELVSQDWLGGDLFARIGLLEQVADRGSVEAIEDCSPLLVLAVPLGMEGEITEKVAVACFVTSVVTDTEQVAAAAHAIGVGREQVLAWSKQQEVWPARGLLSLGKAWLEAEQHRQASQHLKLQLTDVSSHLLSTFEELSMLHRLTERLSLSSSESELCELALHWLKDIIPSESLVVVLNESGNAHENAATGTHESFSLGQPLLAEHEMMPFVDRLGPEALQRCLVFNRDKTRSPLWRYPSIREVISVPIRSGEKNLGWILALNYKPKRGSDTEFGTVEASLLSSVAAILGVHSGNIDLYREQNDFFESVIRALSSSIDAKDPYTCGHSDRVARISVCIARELGCDTEQLNTIYLSGLLHDIGKIGIDDKVLRKTGKLTDEEYEHIKTHPELGRRILSGVKQLGKVVPVVLHHHEAWDGSGYPGGLVAEECPRLARIVAVADAIDAMGSDRPYRKGMPTERLESILSEGAGKQWDPEVVDAYLSVRDEVRSIVATDREVLSLDVRTWDC